MGKTNVLIVFGPGRRKPRTGYSQSAAPPSVRSLVRPRISIYCQVLTVAPNLGTWTGGLLKFIDFVMVPVVAIA